MTPKIQTILTELCRRFETLYGERLVRMVLFGSQARGDAEPGSDIDVLVVLKGSVSPCEEIARTGEIVADLSLHFNEVISCVFMDEERFTHRNGPLLRNVRREGISI
jgi:predicted nucleotidyltransferase